MTPPTLTLEAIVALRHLAGGGELVRDERGFWYCPGGVARVPVTQREAATLLGWQLIERDWSAAEGVRYRITARGREAIAE